MERFVGRLELLAADACLHAAASPYRRALVNASAVSDDVGGNHCLPTHKLQRSLPSAPSSKCSNAFAARPLSSCALTLAALQASQTAGRDSLLHSVRATTSPQPTSSATRPLSHRLHGCSCIGRHVDSSSLIEPSFLGHSRSTRQSRRQGRKAPN